jgi:prefoldin subunit 5
MNDDVELAALKVKVGYLEQQIAEMRADLKAIRETLAEIRGGKKALWLLMGAAGSFGAAMTWLLQHASPK